MSVKKAKPLVDKQEISIAMLGMVDGNGHPYSWSAIFNGYDAVEMQKCPFPVIPEYLNNQPKETLQIKHARVTHIWTDDLADAKQVARAAYIPHIVEQPEDVIGQVDAVIIATDIGAEHVQRGRPFVEAGIPIFVDKPLADNEEDLRTFCRWVDDGASIMSGSSLRYCKEFMPFRASTHNLGAIRFASITTPKSWERYGIHALEAIYPIIGPGFLSVCNTGTSERNIVHCKHTSGADIIAVAIDDMYGGFGMLQLAGTKGRAFACANDSFYGFKTQLLDFIHYLRTGIRPYPFAETVELMKILIAGIRSREENGREVMLEEIDAGIRT